MFLLSVALFVVCGPIPELARNTQSLELGFRVIEAFEHGPVIFEVSLTNRGTKPLVANRFARGDSRIAAPQSWQLRYRYLCWSGGSGNQQLEPGETWTERHKLHLDFMSPFPSGTHSLGVEWFVWPPEGRGLFALPQKTFTVTLTPATPANRKALAARLEAEFAALPPDARGGLSLGSDDDPLSVFSAKVLRTPHKELAPLALRIVDRCGEYLRTAPYPDPDYKELIEAVLRAGPVAGHRAFVDRLVARVPRVNPWAMFEVWLSPEQRLADLWLWRDNQLWNTVTPAEIALGFARWADHAAPCLLPDAELHRLLEAKDFWVRLGAHVVFRDRLGR